MKIKFILTKNEKVMMWVNEGYECLPKHDKSMVGGVMIKSLMKFGMNFVLCAYKK